MSKFSGSAGPRDCRVLHIRALSDDDDEDVQDSDEEYEWCQLESYPVSKYALTAPKHAPVVVEDAGPHNGRVLHLRAHSDDEDEDGQYSDEEHEWYPLESYTGSKYAPTEPKYAPASDSTMSTEQKAAAADEGLRKINHMGGSFTYLDKEKAWKLRRTLERVSTASATGSGPITV